MRTGEPGERDQRQEDGNGSVVVASTVFVPRFSILDTFFLVLFSGDGMGCSCVSPTPAPTPVPAPAPVDPCDSILGDVNLDGLVDLLVRPGEEEECSVVNTYIYIYICM